MGLMVAPGGARYTYQCNLGGYLAGGQEEERGRDVHLVGGGEGGRYLGQASGILENMGWRRATPRWEENSCGGWIC